MIRRPPRSTRTYTLVPYTTLCRSVARGVIKAATISVGDNDGFARTLAGVIDLDKALAEGYRRNHSGDYAEAAEFFEALSRRALDEQAAAGIDPTEFPLNRALQRSNLGAFPEAARTQARRVGKECVSTCRYSGSSHHYTTKQ